VTRADGLLTTPEQHDAHQGLHSSASELSATDDTATLPLDFGMEVDQYNAVTTTSATSTTDTDALSASTTTASSSSSSMSAPKRSISDFVMDELLQSQERKRMKK
jgi:hypothetical protein